MHLRALACCALLANGLFVYSACKQDAADAEGGGGAGTTVSASTGFTTDGAHICGDEFHDALTDRPLLYFALDRSGSMTEVFGNQTRYTHVRDAAGDLVDDLGGLIRAGAAIFPGPGASTNNPCREGAEVFPPTVAPGASFKSAINVQPLGGTPIAATLLALAPVLAAQPQPRVVILATDGGPNCNGQLTCDESLCIPNMAGECPAQIGNCCEPPDGNPGNCLDRLDALFAIQTLAEAGTPVYVVGIPGSEPFAAVLDQMALMGGVPQQGSTSYYYRVDDLDLLSQLFKDIASELVSCTFDLTDPPEEQGLTNVYFDGGVVPQDPVNGWIWVDEDTIELVGAACQALKNGDTAAVQVVSGCPTEAPL